MSYLVEGGGEPVKGGAAAAPSEKEAKRWPCLIEYMTALAFESGKSRQTATVTVSAEDGRWKGVLNDRQNRRSLFVAADDINGALDGLEKAAVGPRPDWRKWKPGR